MPPSVSLIITSIAAPNKAMKAFAKGCRENNIEFMVIADRKSPKDFLLKNCRFVSIQEQASLPFKIIKFLPFNHYSRKNIGYLLAKNNKLIIESDDDNFPKENFWKNNLELPSKVQLIKKKGWVNIYSHFTKETIWPRGLPLERLEFGVQKVESKKVTSNSITPIIQSLADENPDVDAVYRLSYPLPQYFNKGKALALSKGSWCPFNSQNTTWMKEAFPLLYLPSSCSFRMTDIWRSFITQRIAWECGWTILFQSPTVVQQRNEHNLVKDFEDEVPGYLFNDSIKISLEELNLKKGSKNIPDNLIKCYEMMIKKKWIAKEEMKLVEAWCEEFI